MLTGFRIEDLILFTYVIFYLGDIDCQ